MNFIDYIDYINNNRFDMYWFFNSKNSEEESTSIFDIDDYDKDIKLEVGKTYTFKVKDLSSINDDCDETRDDYELYIKNKDEITIIINWMEVSDSDEDDIDCNVGFSFIN